ncbi:MAG: thioredoxin family protein [Vallitaleaceae bacterium]|jgi:small redox-active disulfide protein 2|nr:thioredoxin family protein [Vallitaleaceae bacterium]
MEIKVLGTGCKKCLELEAKTKQAIEASGKDITLTKVTEIKDIMGYGLMSTPGLVIDEVVKSMGRVPKVKEIIKYIEESQ